MKRLFALFAAAAVALAAASCGPGEEIPENTVYTTFYAMYDFTREIAGDKMNVAELVPSGSGPHDFEPTASDIAKVTDSKALIYCGSVDTYIDAIKETAESAGVKTLDTAAAANISDDIEDAHIWLDPDTALAQYTAIAELLSDIDPDNAAYYSERLASVKTDIDEIKSELADLKTAADKQDIIVSHAAYGYLCGRLGIEQHAIESGSGEGSDPTAKQMAELIGFAGEKGIKIVFAQKGENDKSARALAGEIGGDVMLLDPLESDTGSGGYFDVMRQNILALGTALK